MLSFSFCFTVACTNNDSSSVATDSGAEASDSAEQTNQTESKSESVAEYAVKGENTGTRNDKIKDIDSIELVDEMKAGWNLGNSLDANGKWLDGQVVSSYETAWGNPVTTKKMIDDIKSAGFNVIRIPITWQDHIGDAPNYTIEDDWMKRVGEVVDYAIDDNTYVIIDLHHESWIKPTEENYKATSDEFIKVWNQIANYFMGYDEHLIFESMNEPRLVDTDIEWTNGNEEARNVINKLNQSFVDTIRATGGNNSLRHLMITGYCSSNSEEVLKNVTIPNDKKIIISIHAYKPYDFTINPKGSSQWSADNQADIHEIKKTAEVIFYYFNQKGIPAIIDEFGCSNKDNLQYRVDWTEYFVSMFEQYGVPCIWWDNGIIEGDTEAMGIYNRKTNQWAFPEIVDAIMKNCK